MKILLINFCVFFRVADFIFWSMLLVSVKTSGTVFKLNILMFELPPYKTLSFFTSPFCDSYAMDMPILSSTSCHQIAHMALIV